MPKYRLTNTTKINFYFTARNDVNEKEHIALKPDEFGLYILDAVSATRLMAHVKGIAVELIDGKKSYIPPIPPKPTESSDDIVKKIEENIAKAKLEVPPEPPQDAPSAPEKTEEIQHDSNPPESLSTEETQSDEVVEETPDPATKAHKASTPKKLTKL